MSEHSVHLQHQQVTCSLREDLYQDLVHLLAVIQRLRSQLLQTQEKLEWEKQRGHQLLAFVSDRKFVCLRSSDALLMIGNGLQLGEELKNEKERGLRLEKQLANEKNHSLQLAIYLEKASESGRQIAKKLENEKQRGLQLDKQLEYEKKRAVQLAQQLERKNKQEFELSEKLESEKEQNLQLTLKLLAKYDYGLQMAANLQKEKQLRSDLIEKLNEDLRSRLHLAKSLGKEMGQYLMQLATLLEIENRVKLTEKLEEVRNQCFKMSLDLEKEREKFINLTTDVERQKQHRLLLAERRRQGAILQAGRLSNQQSAVVRMCAVVVELLLEKEKNRCMELELRLQKEKLRSVQLEHR